MRRDSGFAVLLIFAMASVMAIGLYYSLPRVAFEAQRDKEQTLIDRGEQYKRAVQLYVRKNKRWPAKVEDLESGNGLRYLRRRYVDPMTGKDEWRAIHVGPTGVLTDSLVKTDKDKKDPKIVDSFISEVAPIGGVDPQAGNANLGLRKRASDGAPPGPGEGGPPQPGQPAAPLQPQGAPPLNATDPTGLPQQLQRQGTSAGPPVTTQTGGISVIGGLGSAPPQPPAAVNPGAPGQPSGAPPGQSPAGQPGNAAQIIQNLLTAPRPGGAPGSTGAPAGQIQGGGIAGFASKFEGEGIKVYHEQEEYQKWEFVYDMSKDPMVSGQNAANGQGQGQNGTNPQTGVGQTPNSTGPVSNTGQPPAIGPQPVTGK